MIDFFVKGGFMMIPMLFVSVATVGFMIERGLALRREKILPPSVLEGLSDYQKTGNKEKLRRSCDMVPSPLSRLLICSLDHSSQTRKENQDAVETQARKEVILLEKWLIFIEITVGIAPLMGLLGTLHGMITLFGGLGANFGAADPALIAAGISVTLNVTFMGLAIAIPSLIGWSFYSKKVEIMTTELETSLGEFIQVLYQGRKKAE